MGTLYFFIALGRIFVRVGSSIDMHGVMSSKSIFNKCRCLESLTIYMLVCFILLCAWSSVIFWATAESTPLPDKPSETTLTYQYNILSYGILLPLALMFYLRGLTYFSLNDFDYFQDIEKVNK